MYDIYRLVYPLYNENEEWLNHDIICYLNNGFNTGYGYGYRFFYINVFQRMFMNREKNIDSIIKSIPKIKKKPSHHIKIFIGLLTSLERIGLEDFLMSNTFNIE